MHIASAPAPSLKAGEFGFRNGNQKGFIAFILFILCGLIVVLVDTPPGPAPQNAPLSAFSTQRAFKHLKVISRAPHPINSAEHDAVRDYILGTLRQLGLNPQVRRTTDVNEEHGIEGALENIVCRLPGRTRQKAVLVVAHYDSVAAGPGASDDGVAVAALLEGARALKSLPQLRRDVIFLFTDGEEAGLLGAQAFVAEDPWAHDVGFVLNFEARGTSGASIMFETSDQNGWLISNFGRAASHPVANSLSYEIYKRLPNDTDFTIFRRAGYSGLNFAFINGLAYYHTPMDSLAHVALGSLQHHGDYVMELTQQFGNATSDDPKLPDIVYFDVLGKWFVDYTQTTGVFLVASAGLLLATALYLGIRSGEVRIGTCLLGLVFMILGVAATVTGAGMISWVAGVLQKSFPVLHNGLWYHPGLFVLAFSAVGLGCSTAFYLWISKWIGSDDLMLGGCLGWFGLALALTIYFPGAAYLFVWPLLFSLLGAIAVFVWRPSSANVRMAVLALSSVPAIVIVTPMMHKIFFAFAAQSTLIVSALLGLLFALVVGEITQQTESQRSLSRMSLAFAGAGLLIAAITVSAI